MSFYIIKEKEELHIIPVQPEREDDFRQQYDQRILASGETVPKTLSAFNEMPVILCNSF
jgi:hypothetical protein